MSSEVAFLNAILENPEDLVIRMAFADWLEEEGDARGELLRIQLALIDGADSFNDSFEIRMQELLLDEVEPIVSTISSSLSAQMVLVSPGVFQMGSDEPESEVQNVGRPMHRVVISRPFFLGQYPVTQGEFYRVMGNNPSQYRGNLQLPVDQISWFDAVEFCNQLSKREYLPPFYKISADQIRVLGGTGYRLPTEAEWEYACRAGTRTRWSFGNESKNLLEYGWFDDHLEATTRPVGELKPNPWGFYDMYGNVWEWCWDWFDEDFYRVSSGYNPRGPGQTLSQIHDAFPSARSINSLVNQSNQGDSNALARLRRLLQRYPEIYQSLSDLARVIRGGSFLKMGSSSATRMGWRPRMRLPGNGFRIARSCELREDSVY